MFKQTDGFDSSLARTQAWVFERSCKLGFDSELFANEYMKSETAWKMDLPHHKIRWSGPAHLLSCFVKEKGIPAGKTWDSDAMFWIGYAYRMWNSLTGQPSRKIGEIADAQVMLANYPKMHMDNVRAAVSALMSRKGFGQENSAWGAFPKKILAPVSCL